MNCRNNQKRTYVKLLLLRKFFMSQYENALTKQYFHRPIEMFQQIGFCWVSFSLYLLYCESNYNDDADCWKIGVRFAGGVDLLRWFIFDAEMLSLFPGSFGLDHETSVEVGQSTAKPNWNYQCGAQSIAIWYYLFLCVMINPIKCHIIF